MRGLGALTAFLMVMAWQSRTNNPFLFAMIGTLVCLRSSLLDTLGSISDWPLRRFAVLLADWHASRGISRGQQSRSCHGEKEERKGNEPSQFKSAPELRCRAFAYSPNRSRIELRRTKWSRGRRRR